MLWCWELNFQDWLSFIELWEDLENILKVLFFVQEFDEIFYVNMDEGGGYFEFFGVVGGVDFLIQLDFKDFCSCFIVVEVYFVGCYVFCFFIIFSFVQFVDRGFLVVLGQEDGV